MPPPDPIRGIMGVIVPRAVESIDLNELIAQIDFNEVINRIDIDAVVARIDVSALVEQIDLNQLLDQLDVKRLLDHIDIAGIVKRAQVDAIMSATAGGLVKRLLDLFRRQLVGLDILLSRATDRVFRRSVDVPVSEGDSVTGQLAGGATRLAAFVIDFALWSVLYAGLVALVYFMGSLFVGHNVRPKESGIGQIIAFLLGALVYQWICLVIAGRTPGRALAGLRVTAPDGSPLRAGAATKRVLVYPFSFILGLGLIGIVIGRQHRALHDVAAPSLVRYDWGDRPAEMPAPIMRYLESQGAVVGTIQPAPIELESQSPPA